MDAPRRAAVLLATDDAGRVLVVRQTAGPFAGAWLLPGGGLAEGESFESALAREVEEETGLEASDLQRVARYEVRGGGEQDFHLHVHMYRGSVTGAPRAERGSAVAWLAPAEIEPLHPVLARQLADAGLDVPSTGLADALRRAEVEMTSLGPEHDS